MKSSTYTGYSGYVHHHLIPELGNYKMCELDTRLFQDFIGNKLKDTVSVFDLNDEFDEEELEEKQQLMEAANNGMLNAKSIHNLFTMLHSVFKAAQKEFYLLISPIEGIRSPKVPKKEIQAMTISEQTRLVEEVRKHMDEKFELRSAPGCFAIIFDLFTGLRKGELLGLQWGDFDFKKGSFRVSRTLQRLPDYSNMQNRNKTILEVGSPKTDCSNRLITRPRKLFKELLEYRLRMERLRRKCGFPPLKANRLCVLQQRIQRNWSPVTLIGCLKCC